jgi:hypothetical protein
MVELSRKLSRPALGPFTGFVSAFPPKVLGGFAALRSGFLAPEFHG